MFTTSELAPPLAERASTFPSRKSTAWLPVLPSGCPCRCWPRSATSSTALQPSPAHLGTARDVGEVQVGKATLRQGVPSRLQHRRPHPRRAPTRTDGPRIRTLKPQNTSSWDWSWSWSSSSSSAHAASTSLSQSLVKPATSLANALKAQAIHVGSVSSKGTGSSRAYVSSSPYTQPYYYVQPNDGPISRVQTVVAPPKPPIIQNPNNGPHPTTASTRPAPKPDWGGKGSGGWKPGDVVRLLIGAAQMRDLANSDQFTPSDAPESLPAPVNNPGGQSRGRTRDDDPGCNPLPLVDGGRIYGGLEEYTNHQGTKGCRATRAFAFLTKSDRRSRTGAGGVPKCRECVPSVNPDGMGEIAAGGG